MRTRCAICSAGWGGKTIPEEHRQSSPITRGRPRGARRAPRGRRLELAWLGRAGIVTGSSSPSDWSSQYSRVWLRYPKLRAPAFEKLHGLKRDGIVQPDDYVKILQAKPPALPSDGRVTTCTWTCRGKLSSTFEMIVCEALFPSRATPAGVRDLLEAVPTRLRLALDRARHVRRGSLPAPGFPS